MSASPLSEVRTSPHHWASRPRLAEVLADLYGEVKVSVIQTQPPSREDNGV